MPLSLTVNAGAREGFESPIAGDQTIACDHISKLSASIPAECSNYLVSESFATTMDALQVLYLIATDAVVVTFFDCDDISVGEIELCANVPALWYHCIGFDHGITGDVAYFNVNNANEEAVILRGRIGHNNMTPCPSP